ncbi:MAG: ABC transporter permease [Candidatus Pelethousia sp.]|nr:ABC transporter permease [Candidatus Pelethousia sp.]
MGLDIGENIRLAWEGLRANKRRALLTLLGIIIGIGSVIGILTVGEGLSANITGEMAAMGAGNVTIYFKERDNEFNDNSPIAQQAFGMSEDDYFTDEMFTALMTRYPNTVTKMALLEMMPGGQVKKGRDYANVSVYGVNENYLPMNDIELLTGRNIRAKDNEGTRNVAMVSDKLVNNMFGGNPEAALGQEVQATLGGDIYTFSVVGVYKYKQSAMMGMMSSSSEKDITTELYIPINTAKRYNGTRMGYYEYAIAGVTGDSRVAATQIEDFLSRYYVDNEDYSAAAMSMESVTDMVSSMMDTLSIAISVIAGISLLVGGIGVMNIMLVSVTERTREIGTRKALGATNTNIRLQFVVESVIICLVGGIIGILFGALLGYAGSSLLNAPSGPTPASIIIAFGFSMAIGVFFGYYPANKAATLDPIEALRYE